MPVPQVRDAARDEVDAEFSGQRADLAVEARAAAVRQRRKIFAREKACVSRLRQNDDVRVARRRFGDQPPGPVKVPVGIAQDHVHLDTGDFHPL